MGNHNSAPKCCCDFVLFVLCLLIKCAKSAQTNRQSNIWAKYSQNTFIEMVFIPTYLITRSSCI